MKVLFLGKRRGMPKINIPVFKKTLGQLFKFHKKKPLQINYVFMGDDELLELNKQFLQHNTYTDIITFDLSYDKNNIEAEIYISLDRVIENSQTFKTDTTDELLRVLFHGVLHLLGEKDKTANQKKQMRLAENECLNLYRETLSVVSRETE
jgi:probable rRNA maturation factor